MTIPQIPLTLEDYIRRCDPCLLDGVTPPQDAWALAREIYAAFLTSGWAVEDVAQGAIEAVAREARDHRGSYPDRIGKTEILSEGDKALALQEYSLWIQDRLLVQRQYLDVYGSTMRMIVQRDPEHLYLMRKAHEVAIELVWLASNPSHGPGTADYSDLKGWRSKRKNAVSRLRKSIGKPVNQPAPKEWPEWKRRCSKIFLFCKEASNGFMDGQAHGHDPFHTLLVHSGIPGRFDDLRGSMLAMTAGYFANVAGLAAPDAILHIDQEDFDRRIEAFVDRANALGASSS